MMDQSERGYRLFPRPFLRLPAETNGVVQVKYTNPNDPHGSFKCSFHLGEASGKKYAFDAEEDGGFLPASTIMIG